MVASYFSSYKWPYCFQMFIHGMYDPKKGKEKILNGDGILTRALPGHYHRPF